MKHTGAIFVIGIILIIMPFLGFPVVWKNIFIFAIGLWLCGIVITRLKRHQPKKNSSKKESRNSSVTLAPNKIPPEPFKESLSEDIHDQPPTV
ncbi:MAG: hypothetical protein UX89_C0001G0072 [Parcubacteria group bacterium GW2011_GWA2_47_16]|nr:MAG: hypothetical protein UX89_C0001G0072 [Parcubacteria group bacterium GW2011_GWA2_47_16]